MNPRIVSLCCGLSLFAAGSAGWAANFHTPPGHFSTSWVGNSFPGGGGPNGLGYWVQNGADEIEVTPDGTVIAGPEVGGNGSWEDMPYAVQALKRKNGEYLVLVEEDWRGKNLLYRWQPATN